MSQASTEAGTEVLASPQSGRFENGFALVVGIGGDLPATVRDAEAVGDILKSPTYCAFPEDQVKVLTRDEADRDGVLAGLEWLVEAVRRKAEAGDENTTAVVYFSGHGVAGSPGKPSYLITHDARLANLSATAVSSFEFTAALRAVDSRRLLVLLDCCHAGSQADAKSPQQREAMPLEVQEMLRQGSGRVVIASSRSEEYSYAGGRLSFFTQAVQEALSGHGASELDGYSRVLDIAMYAAQVVPHRTYDKQHPILKVSDLDSNYPIAYYAGGETRQKLLPKGRRQVRAEEPEAARREVWNEELDELAGEELELEARLEDQQTDKATRGTLEEELGRVRERMDEARGRMGLLPRQTEKNRTMTMVWSWLGLLSFLFSYSVYAQTQGWPAFPGMPVYDFGAYAVAVVGILYGLPLLALTLAFTSYYQQDGEERGFLNRLPIAFNVPFFADTRPRRLYQGVALVLFLFFPLFSQGHFFNRMLGATLIEGKEQAEVKLADGEKVTCLRHFAPELAGKAMSGGDRDFYRLQKDGPGKDGRLLRGISFYPFWQPLLFLLLEIAVFVWAGRILYRMWASGARDDPRPGGPVGRPGDLSQTTEGGTRR